MKEREELIAPHALINIKKKYIKIGVFLWWTIKGLSRCLKKMQAFSEPFHGFSSQSKAKKKHPERGAFSLVDDQGLEPQSNLKKRAIFVCFYYKKAQF